MQKSDAEYSEISFVVPADVATAAYSLVVEGIPDGLLIGEPRVSTPRVAPMYRNGAVIVMGEAGEQRLDLDPDPFDNGTTDMDIAIGGGFHA